LSAVSHALFIDRLGDAIQRALGRNPKAPPGSGSTVVTIGAKPSLGPSTPDTTNPPQRPGKVGSSPRRSQGPTGPPGARSSLPPLRTPTKDDPLRVLVVGDSFATDTGYGLARAFNTHVVSLTLHGVISSGLARPDFYPWPQKFQQDVEKLQPEIVVIMIGGNDFHSVLLPDGHSVSFNSGKVWRHAYYDKVTAFLREASAGGARVAWVGLPIMGDPGYSKGVMRLNSVYKQAVAKFRNAEYLDSWHLFTNRRGKYAAYLPDSNGDLQPVRTADNIHLTPQGNDRLATYAIAAMQEAWHLPRKAIAGG